MYTADQVRQLDAHAIEAGGIESFALMQRAGRAAFREIRERHPEAGSWCVVTGAGNNAGDGFEVACLALEAGMDVEVVALRPVADLRGDAARAAAAWLDTGGAVRTWPDRPGTPGLVADALLGTGLGRDVEGEFADAVGWINAQACPVAALDVPSGLDADTGAVRGCAVRAGLTVSFVGRKRGLYTADGPDHAGERVFDALGAPEPPEEIAQAAGWLLDTGCIERALAPRPRNAHKGRHGHVLVIGGAAGMGGAVRLAGEAALRSGAGLVSVATDTGHSAALVAGRPELMVRGVQGADELEPLLVRADVLAVGPGLGQGAWSRGLLDAALAQDRPLVLDADGLNLLDAEIRHAAGWVLTPHPGEAARLLGMDTASVQSDRFAAAARLAERHQAVVVLKGAGTLVAGPDGRYAVCALGNPGMATAGCGDVLTGVIAALLAQGLDPWTAATVGVTAHAAAGDLVARNNGERGLLAGDVAATLPRVLNPGSEPAGAGHETGDS